MSEDIIFTFVQQSIIKYSISLHIYSANEAKDSFMIEPTYDKAKKNLYNLNGFDKKDKKIQ